MERRFGAKPHHQPELVCGGSHRFAKRWKTYRTLCTRGRASAKWSCGAGKHTRDVLCSLLGLWLHDMY